VERSKLEDDSRALARERIRLEEAWSQLNLERARLECSSGLSTGHKSAPLASFTLEDIPAPSDSVIPSAVSSEVRPVPSAISPGRLSYTSAVPRGQVPDGFSVTVGAFQYSVLPLKEPDAPNLGHDLWNHIVEVPEGWEVMASDADGFDHTISVLAQHRWGAMVLGVRSGAGFDAYWTPLFGDGSHAGQCCQADVDWIEPIEDDCKRFRMTYSGLRLLIRAKMQAQETSTPSGFGKTERPGPILSARGPPVQRLSSAPVGVAALPAARDSLCRQHVALGIRSSVMQHQPIQSFNHAMMGSHSQMLPGAMRP